MSPSTDVPILEKPGSDVGKRAFTSDRTGPVIEGHFEAAGTPSRIPDGQPASCSCGPSRSADPPPATLTVRVRVHVVLKNLREFPDLPLELPSRGIHTSSVSVT
jgi:hypothetical protein